MRSPPSNIPTRFAHFLYIRLSREGTRIYNTDGAFFTCAAVLVLFVLSIALVTAGWKMTGQLAGLGIMLLGVALLLAVLALYNAPYQD